jgi:hypothetical protein
MSKVTIKARKLSDPRVQYVSLVDRGANRIPFRIIKRQNQESTTMIDLTKIFKGDKTASTSPVVIAALAVEKREDMEPVRKALQDAGFSIDTEVERDDGAILFQQVEKYDEADTTIYKVNEDIVALVTGSVVAKSEEKTFVNDLFGELGYMPSAAEACMAVCESVLKEAGNATDDNFEDYMKLVKSDMSDLADYIGEALQTIPVELTDMTLPEVVVKAEEPVETPDAEPAVAPVAKADDAPAAAAEETESDDGDVAALVSKAVGPVATQLTELMTSLKAVSDTVLAVKEELDSVKDGQTELATKVDAVETVAKAANEAVGGTIVSGDPVGDKPPATRIQKTEDDDPRTGNFDTAFMNRANH